VVAIKIINRSFIDDFRFGGGKRLGEKQAE
jgi:hypothetical protein